MLVPLIWIWLVVAIVAAIGEIMGTGLFLASISVAALAAGVLSFFLPFGIQVAAFAALSLLGIAVFRPVIVHALGMDAAMELTGPVHQSHLVGRRAVVIAAVDSSGGQIRIGQGEFWSARAYEGATTIPVGTPVEIELLDGVTALVSPIAPIALETESDLAEEKGT